MNASDRAHWLEPSPPLAVDDAEHSSRSAVRTPTEPRLHDVRVRDRRERFGDDHVFAAECSCGWSGEPRMGVTAERVARRDGQVHQDAYRPPHGRRGRG